MDVNVNQAFNGHMRVKCAQCEN